MKEYFTQRLAQIKKKIADLKVRSAASSDVNEVRSINDQITELREEEAAVNAALNAIEADEAAAAADPEPTDEDARGTLVNGGFRVGSFRAPEQRAADEHPTASMEYRQAFRNYVVSGAPIPDEFRNEAINIGDAGAAIPVTVMNEVINTVRKRYGNLYGKVRKLNIRGGVEFPIGALQATWKWIGEKTISPRQDLGKLGKVSFNYHTLEIRVAQTFLSNLLSLDAFEAEIAKAIAIAYLQAMDEGIVIGSGDGSMLGILNDPRVTNVVEMTAADFANWQAWRKKLFSKLTLGYRFGEFIFPLSTVESYLETMADANGNPIFRQATGLEVNDGDAINPNGRFFGRDISLVEPDILPDFDTASAGDVVGIFWQPQEYGVNENFAMTMMRYFDQETNEWVDKGIAVVDGKILNPTGYWLIKKKA